MEAQTARQYFAKSALQVHGLPPCILPLDSIKDFSLSGTGRVHLTLSQPIRKHADGYTILYSTLISGHISFGEISQLQGVQFTVDDEGVDSAPATTNRGLSLPVDSLTVDWVDLETEVIELSMGPASARIPTSAFEQQIRSAGLRRGGEKGGKTASPLRRQRQKGSPLRGSSRVCRSPGLSPARHRTERT